VVEPHYATDESHRTRSRSSRQEQEEEEQEQQAGAATKSLVSYHLTVINCHLPADLKSDLKMLVVNAIDN